MQDLNCVFWISITYLDPSTCELPDPDLYLNHIMSSSGLDPNSSELDPRVQNFRLIILCIVDQGGEDGVFPDSLFLGEGVSLENL